MNKVDPKGVRVGGSASQHGYREYDCVELYLPKRLSYLSRLYDYLDSRLKKRKGRRTGTFTLDGFSIYEVDGAWRDDETEQVFVADERTLVIRVLLQRHEPDDADSLQQKIMELARDVAAIAPKEKAIFISHYRQNGFTFLPDPST